MAAAPPLAAGLVRAKGLEPPHLAILEPKSSASTSSATPAWDTAGKGSRQSRPLPDALWRASIPAGRAGASVEATPSPLTRWAREGEATMASQPYPEQPGQPTQPAQPDAPPPEIAPPGPDIDVPAPGMPAGDPGTANPI